MRSRTFLHVSLGVLALALAYHLGARSATAQAGAGFLASWGGGPYVVESNGNVWWYTYGCGNCPPWQLQGNIFGGAPNGRTIVQFDDRVAVASSGEVFFNPHANGGIGPWSNIGVPPAGPTPAIQESFGSLKTRYRGEREPQGVKPSTNR